MLTSAQLELRRNHIGSSDAPAIMGLSPWGTPTDIFYSKRPDLVNPNFTGEERKSTDAIAAGNYLEDSILRYASDNLGVELIRNQFRVSKGPDKGILSATFDALVKDRNEAVEAKTTGITYFISRDQADLWGEPDTNEVPDYYLIQCHHQILTGNLDRVWLFALIGGRGFVRYRIDRSEPICKALGDSLMDWWEAHVIPGVPPDPTVLPPESLIRSVRPTEGKVIDLDNEALALIAEWEAAKELTKDAEKNEGILRLKVEMVMGDAMFANLPDGRQVKRVLESRSYFDKKALESENPELVAKHTTNRPNENPTLRIVKAPKKGK